MHSDTDRQRDALHLARVRVLRAAGRNRFPARAQGNTGIGSQIDVDERTGADPTSPMGEDTKRAQIAAAAAALVAGTAVALAPHAASRAWGDEAAALLIALVAAWLTQAIPPLIRRRRTQ